LDGAVIRALPLLLLLTGCATVQGYATCDNARAALLLAQRAADRLCPIP
jgi:hypothetical protein